MTYVEKKKSSGILTIILVVIISLIWGLSFLFTKVALTELNVYEVLAIRWVIPMIAFWILYFLKVVKIDMKGKPLLPLIGIAALQAVLYAILEAKGIDLTTSTESSIFIGAIPVMVIAETALVFRIRTSKRATLGVFLAFIGLVLCVVFAPGAASGGSMLGYLFLFLAMTSGATYTILCNKVSKKFTTTEITFVMSTVGGICHTIISMVLGNGLHPYQVFFAGGSVMGALIFLGLGCGMIAYMIYNYNIAKLSPVVAACVQNSSINVVGVLAGIILMKDPWGWYTILGLVLITAGIYLTATDKKE